MAGVAPYRAERCPAWPLMALLWGFAVRVQRLEIQWRADGGSLATLCAGRRGWNRPLVGAEDAASRAGECARLQRPFLVRRLSIQ